MVCSFKEKSKVQINDNLPKANKLSTVIKNIFFLACFLILTLSCNSNPTTKEIDKLKGELDDKEMMIKDLQNKIDELEKEKFIVSDTQTAKPKDLNSGAMKLIDKKDFNDTLDISDNFFIYKHTSKINEVKDSNFESVLRDFDQVETEYGNDFFVRVMTFYNGQSLPLETENSRTNIHVLVQPTELGNENESFLISDFYDVDLIALDDKGDIVELIFEHGKFPRKRESIIIRPGEVKFAENVQSKN